MVTVHILSALFCRRIDNGDPGISLIDCTNSLTLAGSIEADRRVPLGATPTDAYLMVILDFEQQGTHTVGLRFIAPSGQVLSDQPSLGTDTGQTLRIPIPIGGWATNESGRHWFEILVDGEPVGRSGLNVHLMSFHQA